MNRAAEKRITQHLLNYTTTRNKNMTKEQIVAKHMGLEVSDLTQECLDDQVHEFCSGEAAGINNSGREDQIEFLYARYEGPVDCTLPTSSAPVKALLRYSWKGIEYKYEGLTQREKDCVSHEQFAKLVEWVKE